MIFGGTTIFGNTQIASPTSQGFLYRRNIAGFYHWASRTPASRPSVGMMETGETNQTKQTKETTQTKQTEYKKQHQRKRTFPTMKNKGRISFWTHFKDLTIFS